MARFDEGLRPEDHPDEYELLPAGTYLAQVCESEIVPTKKGDGQILKATFQILEGQYEGRLIWERLNIKNPNPQAQSIALKSLAKLARACGIDFLEDSEELHFKPVLVRLGIRKDKEGQYPDQNAILGYEMPGTPQVTAPGQPGQQQQVATQQAVHILKAAPAKSGDKAPWRKST